MTKKTGREDRRQQRLRRLDAEHPVCNTCGKVDQPAFENHHLAGRKHSPDVARVCVPCHRTLSDWQHDHPRAGSSKPGGALETIGRYLLGLADLFELIVEALRRFGVWLVGGARGPLPQ